MDKYTRAERDLILGLQQLFMRSHVKLYDHDYVANKLGSDINGDWREEAASYRENAIFMPIDELIAESLGVLGDRF